MHHLIARPVMIRMADAIEKRIAHFHIGRGHIDPGAQNIGSIRKLSRSHALKQIQIFFDGVFGKGADLAGRSDRSAIVADLFFIQPADIGFARFDQLNGEFDHFFKVIRCMKELSFPIKTEPMHIFLDRLLVSDIFFGRIGIIKTKMAYAMIFFGNAEI